MPQQFILQAFDRELWCPVLQSKFAVSNIDALRNILNASDSDDAELTRLYHLDTNDLEEIDERFGARLDAEFLAARNIDVQLFRAPRERVRAPYLLHTGYELPLLLDGRKKLAKMYHEYPPMNFPGEEVFDRWVTQGILHKELDIEPFGEPVERAEGLRTAYYTLKGEEWRAPAMKFIWQAARKAGGWNEYFERLEGMLFGYEDWQNDWHIAEGVKQGQFAGTAICYAINAAQFEWMEATGFRALPPTDEANLLVLATIGRDEAELTAFMQKSSDSVALIRFNVPGIVIANIINIREAGPWSFPSSQLPELNRSLSRSIEVIDRRTPD